jgi:hypothetical protein
VTSACLGSWACEMNSGETISWVSLCKQGIPVLLFSQGQVFQMSLNFAPCICDSRVWPIPEMPSLSLLASWYKILDFFSMVLIS